MLVGVGVGTDVADARYPAVSVNITDFDVVVVFIEVFIGGRIIVHVARILCLLQKIERQWQGCRKSAYIIGWFVDRVFSSIQCFVDLHVGLR